MNWTITTKSDQFSAKNVATLKEMASMGTISGGDLIQRPNSKEWHYAFELPELQDYVSPPSEPETPSKGYGRTIIGMLLLAASGYFFHSAYQYRQQATQTISILGQGENELKSTEGLILPTEAVVYSDAYGNDKTGKLSKHTKISLERKKNNRFQVKSEKGTGWVRSKDIVPGYLFLTSQNEKNEKIKFFNPHEYLEIISPSLLPKKKDDPNSLLAFQLYNKSGFEVTNIRFEVEYEDEYGKKLSSDIIQMQGFLSEDDTATVGTVIAQNEFGTHTYTTKEHFNNVLLRKDPNLTSQWVDSLVLPSNLSYEEINLFVVNADVVTD